MARLIDADQFKAKLLSLMDTKSPTPSDVDCMLDGVLNLLDEQPTETPESWVKHGRWIVYPTLVSFLRCSQCHHGVGWHDDKKPNYCPNCGARMDGEQNVSD